MCGIVGYCGNKNAGEIILNGLKKMEYRGYDSAGMSLVGQDKLKTIKSIGKLENLKKIYKENPIKGSVGIGHTRWATHGEVSLANAHPHLNTSETIALVHNGIIENYQDLKKELENLDYSFKSKTDTEVIVQLIDYYYNGNLLNAVLKSVKRLKGSYALGVISMNNPSELIAVRYKSPLIVGLSDDGYFISSELSSLVEYTNKVIYMENNEIAQFSLNNEYKFFNYNLDEIQKEITNIDLDSQSISKNGFDHYMLKEIFEQPDAIRNTLEKRIVENKIKLGDSFFTKEEIEKFNKIYIIACGTAFHAGEVAKFAIQKFTGRQVICDIASEFNYNQKFIDENTLTIFVSQSGETADTLLALENAKKLGAKILAIVNSENSTMTREADKVIYCYCGPEISVASTKAYTSQLLQLYLIALDMADKLGTMSKEEITDILEELMLIPGKIEFILSNKDDFRDIAEDIKNESSVYYTGRGIDFISAKEGALKLKEISYIHTEAMASGELKHGSIALMEKNTKIIAVVTQNFTVDKIASNLEELKSRGADIYTITTFNNSTVNQNSKQIIKIPETIDILAPFLSIIPSQFIAYYTSLAKGNDVDKPRNLAKSVTVE
ncbi:glutamine--fructose-6-phosphate transaminase (isomerizing) [Peptoniphilus catoniae]|uniref:glutamine--fructose-6-phosphate transaminase (isomerizing) n=1 Tax=Peptoniphilus catoniae TaxID=1660341 RepID=UPI0010FF11B7|nr:glutamine--fructose-6-phosphate transaminase (isomerizing) [Peptoniphilus catoniae]